MYELMIASTTGGAESLLSRVEKFLREAEALDLKVNKLGKKQLAYPIKKQTEAEYFVLNFEAEGTNLKSITDKLRLEQEDLLRYMLISAKVYKPSRRKSRKVVEAPREEKKEAPKVTVVTKTGERGSFGKTPFAKTQGKQDKQVKSDDKSTKVVENEKVAKVKKGVKAKVSAKKK